MSALARDMEAAFPQRPAIHMPGETFESVGVFSGQRFFRATCGCGWKGLDENDRGLAAESYKRHARIA